MSMLTARAMRIPPNGQVGHGLVDHLLREADGHQGIGTGIVDPGVLGHLYAILDA